MLKICLLNDSMSPAVPKMTSNSWRTLEEKPFLEENHIQITMPRLSRACKIMGLLSQILFPLCLSAKAPGSRTLFSTLSSRIYQSPRVPGESGFPSVTLSFPKCPVCSQFPNIFTVQLKEACINIKYLYLCDSDLELGFGRKARVKLLLLISSKGALSLFPWRLAWQWTKSVCLLLACTDMTAMGSPGLTPEPSFPGWGLDGVSKVEYGSNVCWKASEGLSEASGCTYIHSIQSPTAASKDLASCCKSGQFESGRVSSRMWV